LDMCGPIATKWMYHAERCMKMLKKYVQNMDKPKTSMAKGYSKDKCIGFGKKYL